MTIQYASDLHLEFKENEYFLKNNPLRPGADVLLLGGDIALLSQLPRYDWFFDQVSENFGVTYWIAGNHEYYHYDLAKKCGAFHDQIRHNVFLVNNFAITLGNIRLIMATLWTEIKPNHQIAIQRRMNDYHLIRFHGDRLTCDNLNTEHRQSLQFITDELTQKPEGLKTIVLTHHVPTFTNYPPEYLGDALNEAFAVDLNRVIQANGPDYWIFGHHHRNMPEFKIGGTTLLTNQMGYVLNKEHRDFDNSKMILI